MDALKKRIGLLFVTVLLFNVNTFAQNKEQEAFNNSYTLEYYGEYAEAAKAIRKDYDEKSYETNIRAGWLHYEAGMYVESQNYYKKAIALKPNSIEAKLGYIYPAAALGNTEQVIEQYKNILKIDPQNTTANYRLGLIYYERKDYKLAYSYFESVVNIYPFGYDALLMYAWSNFQLGKTKEAKVLFKKSLLLYPTSESALQGLSLIK
jgi:tetratricopeptide (TPR) repeat protein